MAAQPGPKSTSQDVSDVLPSRLLTIPDSPRTRPDSKPDSLSAVLVPQLYQLVCWRYPTNERLQHMEKRIAAVC